MVGVTDDPEHPKRRPDSHVLSCTVSCNRRELANARYP